MARILMGVAGSIAAYRSPDLVKLLKAKGHEVQNVLTFSASHFVTAKTLESFSGKPVLSNDSWADDHQGTDHISYARWSDLVVVYGATANLMAKLASGLCDDFLSLQILATKAPVLLVPAMNVEMWKNPATQENYKKLISRGFRFSGPIEGVLACGEVGVGHIADLHAIASDIENILESKKIPEVLANYFHGKKVLVSLGSMRSNVDDVRFLQNKSSGRMGIEIAKTLSEFGADVQILAGFVDSEVEIEFGSFKFERFENFSEYKAQLQKLFSECEIFFSLAAVLDFEIMPIKGKLERGINSLSLELKPTQDMVAWATANRKASQRVVAFSLESAPDWNACLDRAAQKLLKKNADLIVVNRAGLVSEGPDSETNSMYLLDRFDLTKEFPLAVKGDLAWSLVREIASYFSKQMKGPDLGASPLNPLKEDPKSP